MVNMKPWYRQDWLWICWCGHDFDHHLTQVDKPHNNCERCNCKKYRQNEIARTLALHWEIIAASGCIGVLVGIWTYYLGLIATK